MNIYYLIKNKMFVFKRKRKSEGDTGLIWEGNGKAVEILLSSLQ